MAAARTPVATYRLQFSRGFTLADARHIVPYLADLGVSDLYASPILCARSGSTHGYDATGPSAVNPELGGETALRALAAALAPRGMGLLCDTVPNHMAAHAENPWWWDVLENGRASAYAGHFDIAWDAAASPGRLVLPVLGAPADEAIRNGELRLSVESGAPVLRYHEARFPIEPVSLCLVLTHALDRPDPALSPEQRESLGRLIADAAGLPPHTTTDATAAVPRREAAAQLKADLRRLVDTDPSVRASIEAAAADFGAGPAGANRLRDLLAAQPYELAYWKEGVARINYRRFFDITDLVALRTEDPRVFDDTHATTLRFVSEGLVSGLRIDHIDGLLDPLAYLQRLRRSLADLPDTGKPQAAATGGVIVVEKILGPDEQLPEDWPCEGTTGYDFLVALDRVFVDPDGVAALRRHAAGTLIAPLSFQDVAHRGKVEALEKLFVAEVNALAADLAGLWGNDPEGPGLSPGALRAAIVQVSACLPVYRTYLRHGPMSEQDKKWIDRAAAEARRRALPDLAPAIDRLHRVLLRAPADPAALAWAQRWQQLTGPAAAKGVEDTALYRDVALVSLNEVGGEPTPPDDPLGAFHRFNIARAERWPSALSATSTHDTKRSEDVRARIGVLSEIHADWTAILGRWREWNRPARTGEAEAAAPTPADESLIYQSLLGAWPLDDHPSDEFVRRIQDAMRKSIREAKLRTSWTDPDEAYEQAVAAFIQTILDPARASPFLADFRALQARTAFHGMLNALSAAVLKLAAPGVPDLYRGTELWDLSLVDPDNRRPVDFDLRRRLLREIRNQAEHGSPGPFRDLLAQWPDGRIKLYTIWRGLALRRRSAAFSGAYTHLSPSGPSAGHLCAFLRGRADDAVIAVAPRLTASLVPAGRFPLGADVWGSTSLPLAAGAPEVWTNALTDETVRARDGALAVCDILRGFPVALLHAGDR